MPLECTSRHTMKRMCSMRQLLLSHNSRFYATIRCQIHKYSLISMCAEDRMLVGAEIGTQQCNQIFNCKRKR